MLCLLLHLYVAAFLPHNSETTLHNALIVFLPEYRKLQQSTSRQSPQQFQPSCFGFLLLFLHHQCLNRLQWPLLCFR